MTHKMMVKGNKMRETRESVMKDENSHCDSYLSTRGPICVVINTTNNVPQDRKPCVKKSRSFRRVGGQAEAGEKRSFLGEAERGSVGETLRKTHGAKEWRQSIKNQN